MSSGIFYPVASTDDCFVIENATFYNKVTGIQFGDWLGGKRNLAIRFPDITIPKNVTITSAYVKLTAYSDNSGAICNANCYFNDIDDAISPTDLDTFANLALTSPVAWDTVAAWTDEIQYDTPELKSILQEIIDRSGWGSGNAIQIIIKDNLSDTSARRTVSSIRNVSGTEKAELYVEWDVIGNVVDSFSIDDSFEAVNLTDTIPETFLINANIEAVNLTDTIPETFSISDLFEAVNLDGRVTGSSGISDSMSASVLFRSTLTIKNAIEFAGSVEILNSIYEEISDQVSLINAIELGGTISFVNALNTIISGVIQLNNNIIYEGISDQISFINAIEMGGTTSFVNALNFPISGTIDISNNLLFVLSSTLIVKNNIYDKTYLDGILSILNRIESDDTGIYNDVYAFSKTHGL